MLTLLRIRAARRVKCLVCPAVRDLNSETSAKDTPISLQGWSKWISTPTDPAERLAFWREAQRYLDALRVDNLARQEEIATWNETGPAPRGTPAEIEANWYRAHSHGPSLATLQKKVMAGKTTSEERSQWLALRKDRDEMQEAGVRVKRNRRNTPRPAVLLDQER